MWKSSSGGRLSNLILGMRLGVVVQVVLRLVKFILRFSQSRMLPAQTVCEYLWKCSHASSPTWRPAPSGAWNCLDASLEHHSRPAFQIEPALATQKFETITKSQNTLSSGFLASVAISRWASSCNCFDLSKISFVLSSRDCKLSESPFLLFVKSTQKQYLG